MHQDRHINTTVWVRVSLRPGQADEGSRALWHLAPSLERRVETAAGLLNTGELGGCNTNTVVKSLRDFQSIYGSSIYE